MGKGINVRFMYGENFHMPYNVSMACELVPEESTCFFQDFKKGCNRAVLFIVF